MYAFFYVIKAMNLAYVSRQSLSRFSISAILCIIGISVRYTTGSVTHSPTIYADVATQSPQKIPRNSILYLYRDKVHKRQFHESCNKQDKLCSISLDKTLGRTMPGYVYDPSRN